jgi:dolichol-phosphate mannosyltransferase
MVPTYNEAENIEFFVETVFEYIPPQAEILVIDDNSPDGTAKIVACLIPRYQGRLHILNRLKKQGLAKAYLAAFEWGMTRPYDVFLEIDADFSHRPEYIPEMLKKILSFDVVIGSRNIEGGGVEGWSVIRNLISKGGSLYSRIVLGCPIKDLTGGFNMWSKTALEKINLQSILSRGYLFQVEMKYRSFVAGCSVKEIPIVFYERKYGKSKMSKKIFMEALINIWKIKEAGKNDGTSQFIKFCFTGSLGAVTNLIIFFILADRLNLQEIPAGIICFCIAGTQNYIINQKWSFVGSSGHKLSIKRWMGFLSVSLLGLAANLGILRIVLFNFDLPYKFIAQALGIMAGMAINFIVSKFVVFRKKYVA